MLKFLVATLTLQIDMVQLGIGDKTELLVL